MGVHTIKMPDLGEGITEVEIVAWRVQLGEAVAHDQVLADVMTDKATVEIPSPVAGKVVSLGGEAGQVLAVGAPLIGIEVAGNTTGALASDEAHELAANKPDNKASGQPPATAPIPAQGAAATPAQPAPLTSRSTTAAATPLAQQAAAPSVAPVRPSGNVPPRAGTGPVAPSAPMRTGVPPSGDKPIASPALRRRAWELGVDLQQVTGTGTGGRIMQADLDAHVRQHGAAAPATAHTQPPRPSAVATPMLPAEAAMPLAAARSAQDELQAIKVIGLRRRIAQKMQDAKRRIPHFAYVEECDVSELEALRAQLNQRFGASRGKLTLLPFLLRAMVLAIGQFPQVNALFDDEAGIITRHSAVHAGIATQTESGLMVPVLRHAQVGDLWANAAAITRLAEAARSGKATRDELSGSTITLTSLGALGGIVSTPIINAPEVAIVGVNRIVERPMLIGGSISARKLMNLSSSFDHRVVDGQDAARFIQAVRSLLEAPATLLVA